MSTFDEDAESQMLVLAQQAWQQVAAVCEQKTLENAARSQGELASVRLDGLELDKLGGKRQRIKSDTGAACLFQCEECGASFTDSASWVKHLNSRRHQRRLGKSLVGSKTSADAVRARIAALDQEPQEEQPALSRQASDPPSDQDSSSDQEDSDDDEMMAELGFSGFGQSKKRARNS